MNALIIGGTSGLGLELGTLFAGNYRVFITGRHDPGRNGLTCTIVDLSVERGELASKLDALLASLPSIDLLVYAAGFSQQGALESLDDGQIAAMTSVGLVAPAMLIQRILRKQNELPALIAVTSTSQWTPRPHEPIYTAVKAGLGMLGNSLSLDPKLGKVLVAAPAGMVTQFWREGKKDTTGMLEAPWVAQQIFGSFQGDFRYKYVRILRSPQRVEVVETR
jgi:short-subunit dehydrogenase